MVISRYKQVKYPEYLPSPKGSETILTLIIYTNSPKDETDTLYQETDTVSLERVSECKDTVSVSLERVSVSLYRLPFPLSGFIP
jgi:hypothetical protein